MRVLIFLFGFAMLAGAALADGAATKALNDLRASKGRAPVSYSTELERAAAAHARDMATRRFFAHAGSDGSSVGDRIRAQGYGWCFAAENIAKGQRNLSAVMQSWTASSGHKKNMLHRKARQFGLARGKGNLWVMVLAAPC